MKQIILGKTQKLFRFVVYMLLPVLGGAWVGVSCTDTWDKHYDSLGDATGLVHEGTLWSAITSNPDFSNFARVIEACNYKEALDGSQVFTVYAPTNNDLSSAEADALIASYKAQAGANVMQENNTVIKEFIQNHMSLYNHSFSDLKTDTLVLMNGKYAVLRPNATINGVKMSQYNQLYSNGILNTLASQIPYLPNVFEAFRKDADYDSIYSFLYNNHFYYKVFLPEQSVEGSIVNGKVQYLDSVFAQRNELFSTLGLINSEDSAYFMIAPTNEVWKQLVEEYEPYFNYPQGIDKRDSMVYTMTRLAIVQGTSFSRTFNPEAALNDSAMSTNCIKNYTNRMSQWWKPFEYYQYYMPKEAKGALNQTEIMTCSNGEVRKAREWNLDKQMTFHTYRFADANYLKEVSRTKDSRGDSVNTVTPTLVSVITDNKFYDKLWGNYYVEFQPDYSTLNHSATYVLNGVLSNIGYDIYLVTAPALAGDTAATAEQRLPTLLRCTLNAPGMKEEVLTNESDPRFSSSSKAFQTTPDCIDYFLLAEDFKFPVCTRDVTEEALQALLKVETRVSNTQLRNKSHTRTMRLNCILVVPHGSLELVDALPASVGTGSKAEAIPASIQGTPGILLYPHGKYTDRQYKAWYMQR